MQSDSQGAFEFTRLPPGQYRVEPFYQGPKNLKFDLDPTAQDFLVSHGSVVLPMDFQVSSVNFLKLPVSLFKNRIE